MMLALLLYAYANKVHASRSIERLCDSDVAFRVICGSDGPDHATIARFRAVHDQGFKALFASVLGLCRAHGMVRVGVVSIDGTKVLANASRGRTVPSSGCWSRPRRLSTRRPRLMPSRTPSSVMRSVMNCLRSWPGVLVGGADPCGVSRG